LPRLAWTVIFILCFLAVTGMTGACHCTQWMMRWNLLNFLPGLASNHNPPISASQTARITGVRHQCLGTDYY
jgi:hypothetical protein